jgi:hypothetical protein
MFDTDTPGSIFAAVSPPADVAASPAEPHRVPLERVEAQICELAGHLAAATCRFLVLLGDFDARRGWVSWEMGSCAQWLSWKCQMSSGTAREHVRVARALRELPVIRARFAAGRLSYAKVRALTRIATPATEAGLAGLAGPMLPAGPRAVSAETPAAAAAPAAAGLPAADATAVRTSSDLADGLVAMAESFLAAKVAGADEPEIYQVVVHAGADMLAEPPAPAGVSAETPTAPPPVPVDPAGPARCHVEDGPAISVSTAQMITCTAALSWMTHGDAGAVLALGRRRRRPSSAIRRAARERDHCRCRFPGCESRRVDLHHIQADWEQAQEPVFRPDTRGGDFSDMADYIRRYYDEHPAA